MQRILILSIYIILICLPLYSQSADERITVIGDSLIGKIVDGQSVREVVGNVKLNQGNVSITCNRAIQYLASNEAELIGNVFAKQDSVTLQTEKGYYYGNLRKTKSTSGIILNDTKVILSADSGQYFFDDAKAFFQTNVKLVDSLTTLIADELTYYRDEDKSVAVGDVNISDKSNIIYADTLTHFRKKKFSIADGHVSISNLRDNLTIFGSHLEDDAELKYTLINKNPLLMQVDTSITRDDSLRVIVSIDTLMIKSIF